MAKKWAILFSILTVVVGWILVGLGFGAKLPPGLNTFFFLSGIALMPSGVVERSRSRGGGQSYWQPVGCES